MKKSLLISAVTLSLTTACDQPQNPTTPTQSPIDTTAFQMPTPRPTDALSVYKFYLDKLDTLDVTTASQAADKYGELFTDTEAAMRDSGYVVFITYYERLERGLNELHVKDTSYNIRGEQPALTTRQQEYVNGLHKNGFQLASAEGMTYVKPDLDVVASWFNPYISPVLKEYLAQLNKENKEGFAADAGIVISPQQYVDRVIWWETFIKNNPSFALLHEAKEKRQYLLTFLLEGMDNTPLKSYKSGTLEPFYKTAYDYLQKTYPNSETNGLVSPYYKALQRKQTKLADSLVNTYRSKGYLINYGE